MTVNIYHGDCLDVLRAMPDNSVDAIATDPPYGLSNTSPDKVSDAIVRWASGDREYMPAGRGFMGSAWDAFVPPPAVWDECFRVLKPGGHLVAFAGSRTQDLMGLSIRLAGLEIRENLAYLYGSGFPKSMDISKQIDKANGRELEHQYALGRHIKERRVALGYSVDEVNSWFGTASSVQHWESQNAANSRVPTLEDWCVLNRRLGLSDEHATIVNRAEAKREVIGKSQHSANRSAPSWFDAIQDPEGERLVTVPALPEAEKWAGWGTALKPSHEPVIFARKPADEAGVEADECRDAGCFCGGRPTHPPETPKPAVEPVILARKPLSEKTVAANTLTWGTGGLNIDATRIGMSDADRAVVDNRSAAGFNDGVYGKGMGRAEGKFTSAPAGRWPANVVLDPDTAKALDQQSGTTFAKPREGARAGKDAGRYGAFTGQESARKDLGDSGGASRFFKVVEPDPPFMYAAKAPKRERPSYTTEDGATVQHATVKPLSIMQWLVKLVTPAGGTVLDPFAGSGTTVEAAILEGFNVIGIEREAEYLPLIQQRIDRATDTLPMAS